MAEEGMGGGQGAGHTCYVVDQFVQEVRRKGVLVH